MIEAAAALEAAVERSLAGMAERGVTEIMGERQRLGEILVEAERAGERARDLRNFERVGQPGAEMVAFVKDEDLGLVRKPAKGGGMNDAVAIAAKCATRGARRFQAQPAAAVARIAGIRCTRARRFHHHARPSGLAD